MHDREEVCSLKGYVVERGILRGWCGQDNVQRWTVRIVHAGER